MLRAAPPSLAAAAPAGPPLHLRLIYDIPEARSRAVSQMDPALDLMAPPAFLLDTCHGVAPPPRTFSLGLAGGGGAELTASQLPVVDEAPSPSPVVVDDPSPSVPVTGGDEEERLASLVRAETGVTSCTTAAAAAGAGAGGTCGADPAAVVRSVPGAGGRAAARGSAGGAGPAVMAGVVMTVPTTSTHAGHTSSESGGGGGSGGEVALMPRYVKPLARRSGLAAAPEILPSLDASRRYQYSSPTESVDDGCMEGGAVSQQPLAPSAGIPS